MDMPIQIEFHEVPHSPQLESLILGKAGRLEHVFPQLVRCHVSIGQPHHARQGGPFCVRIALHVPGAEIVNRGQHEDLNVALRNAFDGARRQLEDHAQKTRREVKHHASGARDSSRQTGEPE